MPVKKSTAKTATKRKTTAKKTATKATKKKAASPKSRSASNKGKTKKKAGDQEVTIDRRTKADRRDEEIEATSPTSQPPVEKREKVQRRRQIDPTTCERDYSDSEVEFMNAMDEYKRTSGRMFPTCSEVLEVIRDLGYVQLTPAEIAVVRPEVNEPVANDIADQDESNELASDEESFDDSEAETAELAL